MIRVRAYPLFEPMPKFYHTQEGGTMFSHNKIQFRRREFQPEIGASITKLFSKSPRFEVEVMLGYTKHYITIDLTSLTPRPIKAKIKVWLKRKLKAWSKSLRKKLQNFKAW